MGYDHTTFPPSRLEILSPDALIEQPKFRHDDIVVCPIGSCRVRVPLDQVASLGAEVTVAPPPFGYIHNASEIIQAFEASYGRTLIPDALLSVIPFAGLRKYRGRDVMSEIVERCDAFIIEISSIRIVELDGFSLQINLFREVATSLGISPAEIKLPHNQPSLWRPIVDRLSVDSVNGDKLRILGDSHFSTMTADEIVSSVSEIASLARKPVLFVGIPRFDFNNREIAERRTIHNALTHAQDMGICGYADPTDLVAEHGVTAAMRDMGHYHDDFVPTVGKFLLGQTTSYIHSMHQRQVQAHV